MALNPLFVVTQDLDSYFVDKDTGLPLANGVLTFYQDSARTVLKPVYTLNGTPPYDPINSYIQLPNPIILSSVGTVQDADGNNVPIYYFPYDGTPATTTGTLQLYYVSCTDSGGNEQFTREAWPNGAVGVNPSPEVAEPGTASSYLVGWDFPLNPYQFGVSGTVIAQATPPSPSQAYIADQTIAVSATTNVAWAQDPITNGLQFTTSATSDAFYVMQYLSGAEVQKMIGTTMSLNVFAYQNGAGNNVIMQVYLFRAPSTATIPTLPTLLGTVASNGVFTLTAAGWNAIPLDGGAAPLTVLNTVLTNADINNPSNNYGFSGYQITNSADIASTDLFAIVVTFAYFSLITSITVNSIALVPGGIPNRPSIQSPDQALRQCQYYYEKTFIGSTVPVTNLGIGTGESYGILTAAMAGGSAPTGLTVRFPTTMRTSPGITFFNPVAANNQIRTVGSSPGDWSDSTAINISAQGFVAEGTPPSFNAGAPNAVHWVADARLGIV